MMYIHHLGPYSLVQENQNTTVKNKSGGRHHHVAMKMDVITKTNVNKLVEKFTIM